MEELNVRTNEMEELEPVNEAEQVSENSNAGAFVAGLVEGVHQREESSKEGCGNRGRREGRRS